CCVFLAEEGCIWLDDVEELGNYCSHTTEVTGAGLAAKLVTETLYCDVGADAARVHFFKRRYEQQIHTFFLQQLSVALKSAGIVGEVFIRAKLGRIDENGSCHRVALRLGRPHQGEMSFVQSAHRGNKTQLASAPRVARSNPHFFDLAIDFHLSRVRGGNPKG